MGRIIRLFGDDHREIQALAPWYVTGKLEAAEQAQVEAHLARCAECQAEVRFQRRLSVEIADLPTDVDQGWRAMRDRIQGEARARPRFSGLAGLGDGAGRFGRPPSWMGWAAAGVLVAVIGAAAVSSSVRTPAYHALGAARTGEAGNVLVMFRPETPERTLRETITAGGARLVNGPSQAGAYTLHVPPARRAALLGQWRGRADILLAEPIDAGGAP